MTFTADNLSLLQAEPTVCTYFSSFNQGDFAATAALFTPQGELYAPFEDPILGLDAIQAYLEQEASNMKADPKEISCEDLPGGAKQVIVKGLVKALVFNVNVRWTFLINVQGQIEKAQVKLLASLQELAGLRPSDKAQSP